MWSEKSGLVDGVVGVWTRENASEASTNYESAEAIREKLEVDGALSIMWRYRPLGITNEMPHYGRGTFIVEHGKRKHEGQEIVGKRVT